MTMPPPNMTRGQYEQLARSPMRSSGAAITFYAIRGFPLIHTPLFRSPLFREAYENYFRGGTF